MGTKGSLQHRFLVLTTAVSALVLAYFTNPFLYGRIDTLIKTLPYLHPLPILIACHSYIDLNLSQISQYSPLSDKKLRKRVVFLRY